MKKRTSRDAGGERLIVTGQQMADLLGVQVGHVSRLVAAGLPVETVGGGRGRPSTFDAVEALAWMRERQAENPTNGSGRSTTDQYREALTKRVELDIAEREDELVSRPQVVREGQAFAHGIRSMVLALPHRLVQHGAILANQRDDVADVARDILLEIAGWKRVADINISTRAARRLERSR